MKIVTGVGENAHVTSKEFRRIIESVAGQGSFIIKCGDNMATDLVSNNLLKIKSGAMIHHGNISSVDPYDEIEINNGTQGMKRIDLVVNRYTKNAETEIESNDWVIIQGTPAASDPEVPAHIVGNLQEGDLIDDCPFCQIVIDGISVTEVRELLATMPSIPELEEELAELNSKTWTVYWTGSLDVTSKVGQIAITDEFYNYKEVYIEALFQGEAYDSCVLPIKNDNVSKHAILRAITTSAGCVVVTMYESNKQLHFSGHSNGKTVQIVNIMVR